MSAVPAAVDAVRAQGEAVSFFRLTRKFVDSAASVPEDASDVLYYTLAVGHHTGVIDCFERALAMPLATYEKLVALMDDEEARYKLEGVSRFGEIEIDKAHVGVLLPAARAALASLDVFNEPGKTRIALSADETAALMGLVDLLLKVRDEPSVYVMARRTS
ncbi:formate hydrogenlyase maturation protein HycH [Arabiibacter massiliensis]|uniref:formate hydrogenlyase maturation protein HycH n=1 Tax=Arabiibacter massiliensis TaxID=1870985 RepID=UPI0018D6E6ED|nr:formate hydrogenlyase maturation protein HycH [Arabiibacter massiliensis]